MTRADVNSRSQEKLIGDLISVIILSDKTQLAWILVTDILHILGLLDSKDKKGHNMSL